MDCASTFRLRFKPLDQYRYHWSTITGILLFLGIRTYLVFYMLLGFRPLIVAFCIVGEFLRCAILSEAMKRVLAIPIKSGAALFPFILLTEALGLVLVLFYLLPKDSPLQLLGLIIVLWTYMVQAIGLIWHSKTSAFKVILGYLVYFLVFSVALLMLSAVLTIAGGLSADDLQTIMDHFQSMQKK